MLRLNDLSKYENIIIQCHDNPDADAIASGYALYEYFKSINKKVKLIYSGRFEITKPNLLEMVKSLEIPIDYVENICIENSKLLITVDCQYGAGNVQKFSAKNAAIIDHHQQEIHDVEMSEIRSYLGSCSTVIWQLLKDADFDVNSYPNIATALYYGLFCDTNNFAEISHPTDKDMRDSLRFDSKLIKKLKNSNLTLNDIETAAVALLRYSHNDIYNFAIFKAHPCDPNILGFISDLALQVNVLDTCVVYNETPGGIKFSVRSCTPEVMASELACFLTEGIGSGGGHAEKAGGFINLSKFASNYPDLNAESYFLNRLNKYYESFDIIYSSNHKLDIHDMKHYKKCNIPVGFAKSCDIFNDGAPILIRTLEGDIETFSSKDIYFMIGIKGEVYPIKREKFEKSYQLLDFPFTLKSDEYFPSVKNRITGESIDLKPYVNACISTGEVYIYARPLQKNTKVFTSWDPSKYMSGKINDFIAIRQDDLHDVYIIENSIFYMTYEEI